ncbi:MAG: hypothetical protein VKJ44_08460 [Synechococcus sp.]|nr:hypothetical protein [Synechococcus sp.]
MIEIQARRCSSEQTNKKLQDRLARQEKGAALAAVARDLNHRFTLGHGLPDRASLPAKTSAGAPGSQGVLEVLPLGTDRCDARLNLDRDSHKTEIRPDPGWGKPVCPADFQSTLPGKHRQMVVQLQVGMWPNQ